MQWRNCSGQSELTLFIIRSRSRNQRQASVNSRKKGTIGLGFVRTGWESGELIDMFCLYGCETGN